MTTQIDLQNQVEQLQKQLEMMKLQQQIEQMQGSQGGSPSGGAASTVHKKHVKLEATSAKGTVIGQAAASGRATLRDTDGEPIQDQEIIFLVTTSRQEVGRSSTDARGVAEINAGSNIGDPQMWLEALGTGFTAVFQGTKEYYPAEAKASVRASLF